MELKHTPRPWHTEGRYAIEDTQGRIVAQVYGEIPCVTERRDYIVRACNAHDELLAAAKAVLADWDDSVCAEDTTVGYAEAERLREAIKKAEGE